MPVARAVRLRKPLATLAACLCFALPAAAQHGKLAQVSASGSAKYSSAQIVSACGLKPGDVVTREDLQAAADRLAQLGPFRNVRYKFSSSGENVTLEFQLEDAPSIPVLFDNFPWFSDEELHQALRDAVVFFDGTAPENGDILERMTQTLQELLAARNIKATVERTFMASPGAEGMIQRFQIAGAVMKVEAIEFQHALAAESPKLAEAARDLRGKPFSRFAIEVFAEEHLLPLYRERGYLRASIGTPQAVLTGNPNQPMPEKVTVLVPITPGGVYRLKEITWNGASALDAATLSRVAALAPGDVANGMQVFGAWERVRGEYGRRGYLDASVTPQESFDDAALSVSYRVEISEGTQYRMGRLVVTGLSVTAERKLIIAWRLPPGQIFDRNYFEEFIEHQARQKGAFADYVVHFSKVGHMLRTNPQSRTVDVLIDFQ
jgi:outer membrane protein assembly factor BamA